MSSSKRWIDKRLEPASARLLIVWRHSDVISSESCSTERAHHVVCSGILSTREEFRSRQTAPQPRRLFLYPNEIRYSGNGAWISGSYASEGGVSSFVAAHSPAWARGTSIHSNVTSCWQYLSWRHRTSSSASSWKNEERAKSDRIFAEIMTKFNRWRPFNSSSGDELTFATWRGVERNDDVTGSSRLDHDGCMTAPMTIGGLLTTTSSNPSINSLHIDELSTTSNETSIAMRKYVQNCVT